MTAANGALAVSLAGTGDGLALHLGALGRGGGGG